MSETGWVIKNHQATAVAPPTQLKSPYVPPSLLKRLWALRKDPVVVDKTPILSVFLLELANIGQLHRMWTEWTAEGQSLWSWIAVNTALWLWLNFYHVFNKDNHFAIWGTRVGIGLNGMVIATIIYFRYFA